MASLEPPVPATAAEGFVARTVAEEEGHAQEDGGGKEPARRRLGRWRRPVGLLLLGIVVVLWTASNFLASSILADKTFNKPYWVTYFNTSFFILPLIPILLVRMVRRPGGLRQWRSDVQAWLKSPRTLRKGNDGDARQASVNASRELLLSDDPMETSQALSTKSYHSTKTSGPTPQLSFRETARLSLEFCILWFLANYFVAACLEYTTVASSTILTSTSSVFTLLFGALLGVEKFTLRKLIAVLASLTGIILISSVDLSGRSADDDHRGDFPEKTLREIAIGDVLAFISAVLYGLYAVFMKKRIADEGSVNMPIFFGLVGLMNVLLLWPGFFILHFTGIERFTMPATPRVGAILVANSTASMVSDLAWAYAVLLTSPIVVTVGLSMTIPLSLIGQMVLNSQTATVTYWIGAVVVVLSFVFVNHEGKKEGSGVRLGDERGILEDEAVLVDSERT